VRRGDQAAAAGPTPPAASTSAPTPDEVGAARLAAVGHHSDAAAQQHAVGAANAGAGSGDAGAGGSSGASGAGESKAEGGQNAVGAGDYDGEYDEEDEEADGGSETAGDAAADGKGLASRIGSWFRKSGGSSTATRRRKSGGATSVRGQKELDALRAEHSAASAELQKLKDRKATLERLLAADTGPDGVFGAFVGQCFSTDVDHYTYKVCPFEGATQDPGSTSLGTWAGFVEGSGYTAAQFSGGLACWNGPARSLRLDMVCGPETMLLKVEEPNRCEYRADFMTPAVCTPEVVAQATARADEALALVARVKAQKTQQESAAEL
jgi:Glucosidase II beta subunit-like protein